MAINHESGGHELRCVIADNSGSVTLVFQGRSSMPGIERGTRLLVRGTVTSLRREAVILNPQYEIVAAPARRQLTFVAGESPVLAQRLSATDGFVSRA
jgi:RecG-like helicase